MGVVMALLYAHGEREQMLESDADTAVLIDKARDAEAGNE